ncbi:MAG: hypothetical protein ABIA76_00075 [Candidatus Diapherotrites archaeon]
MNKNHKTEITLELLPWIHHVNSVFHGDLINYIKSDSVPKNSFLALEILTEYHYPQTELIPKLKEEPVYLAISEILLACRSKNIKIIPLETPYSSMRSEKAFQTFETQKTFDSIKNRLKAITEMENDFIKQIETSLKGIKFNPKTQKFLVITGGGHTPFMHEKLSQKGINSWINTEIFKGYKKIQMQKLFEENIKERKALKENNAVKMNEAKKEYTRIERESLIREQLLNNSASESKTMTERIEQEMKKRKDKERKLIARKTKK